MKHFYPKANIRCSPGSAIQLKVSQKVCGGNHTVTEKHTFTE